MKVLSRDCTAPRTLARDGSLFWALGELTDGRVVYVPVSGLMVAEHDRILHATKVQLRPSRRRTVDTLCGIPQKARLLLADLVDRDGVVVPVWAPPFRFAGMDRCVDCELRTGGRVRPHRMYLGLTVSDDAEAVPA